MIAIPLKYAVSQVIGCIQGKNAIHLARVYLKRKRNFVGQHFWARNDREGPADSNAPAGPRAVAGPFRTGRCPHPSMAGQTRRLAARPSKPNLV